MASDAKINVRIWLRTKGKQFVEGGSNFGNYWYHIICKIKCLSNNFRSPETYLCYKTMLLLYSCYSSFTISTRPNVFFKLEKACTLLYWLGMWDKTEPWSSVWIYALVFTVTLKWCRPAQRALRSTWIFAEVPLLAFSPKTLKGWTY